MRKKKVITLISHVVCFLYRSLERFCDLPKITWFLHVLLHSRPFSPSSSLHVYPIFVNLASQYDPSAGSTLHPQMLRSSTLQGRAKTHQASGPRDICRGGDLCLLTAHWCDLWEICALVVPSLQPPYCYCFWPDKGQSRESACQNAHPVWSLSSNSHDPHWDDSTIMLGIYFLLGTTLYYSIKSQPDHEKGFNH